MHMLQIYIPESCCASMSDSASSMMVGVEFAGGVFGSAGKESVKQSDDVALLELEEEIFAWERDVMAMEMDDCDGANIW